MAHLFSARAQQPEHTLLFALYGGVQYDVNVGELIDESGFLSKRSSDRRIIPIIPSRENPGGS
jgi:hypothetical protein